MEHVQVATGACGASTPVAPPHVAMESKSDQESARMIVEDLTMR